MKLRNKKTGQEGNFIINKDHFECVDLDCVPIYSSLSELINEWEDYKPAEPLIKDEKVRKAVRAFSEVVQENNHIFVIKQRSLGIVEFCIGSRFLTALPVSDETSDAIEDRTYYTIVELCGDEEE